jgi:predicted nucleic acid-binding Zn ribbon protein
MTRGRIYICQNRDCGCEVTVVKESIEENANPMCCCGTEMKKLYEKPTVRTLKKSEMEFSTSPKSS